LTNKLIKQEKTANALFTNGLTPKNDDNNNNIKNAESNEEKNGFIRPTAKKWLTNNNMTIYTNKR